MSNLETVQNLEALAEKYLALQEELERSEKEKEAIQAQLNGLKNGKNSEDQKLNEELIELLDERLKAAEEKVNELQKNADVLSTNVLKAPASKAKDELSLQIKALRQTNKKNLESINSYQTQIDNLKKEFRGQIKTLKSDVKVAIGQVDVYSYVFKNIILPKFAAQFPAIETADGDRISPVKFSGIVNKAKDYDKQYRRELKREYAKSTKSSASEDADVKVPERDTKSYSLIVEDIVKDYEKFMVDLGKSEEGKAKVAEFSKKFSNPADSKAVVEDIIADKSKWNAKDIFKTKRVLTLVGVAAIGLVAGIVLSSVFGGNLGKANKTIDQQNDTINMNEVVASVQVADEKVSSNYDIIETNDKNAQTVDKLFGNEDRGSSSSQTVKTLKAVDQSGYDSGYRVVQQAKTDASAIISYNSDGSLNANSSYGSAMNELNKAVERNDLGAASNYADQIVSYSDQIANYAMNSNGGFAEMIESAGISWQDIVNMVNNPTATVDFSGVIDQYAPYLVNPSESGSEKVKMISNEYVKDTGAVNIIVEGVNSSLQKYYNLISYNIQPGLLNVTVEDMMAPLVRGDLVSMNSFSNTLETNISGSQIQMRSQTGEEVSGNSDIRYSVTSTYNAKSDTTKISATALVLVRDEQGKVIGFNTVAKYEKNYGGNVSVRDKESDVIKGLTSSLSKVVNQEVYFSVDMENEA